MKRTGIVSAIFVILILCALAYRFIPRSISDSSSAPPTVTVQDVPSPGASDSPSPADASASKPTETHDKLTMESLLQEMIGTAGKAENELVTEPEKCVFLGQPHQYIFLQTENRLILINYSGIYAFDIASGTQIWHRYLASDTGQQGASYQKQRILAWTDSEVFLLDPITGKETWRRDKSPCGALESAQLSPGGSEVIVTCKRGLVLYSVDSHTQRVRPKAPDTWPLGCLPDNKTLILAQQTGVNDDLFYTLSFMDMDTSVITQGWDSPASWSKYFSSLSNQGLFAEAGAQEENNTTLIIRDAQSGKVLREFKGIPGKTRRFIWTQDAKRLLSLTSDRAQLRIIDPETGVIIASLSRDGHRFNVNTSFLHNADADWIFSQDEANNLYVWPLTPEGTPQKVLDGGIIAPGYFRLQPHNHDYMVCTCYLEENMWEQIAFSLKDVRKLDKWRFKIPENGWYHSFNNEAMTHHVQVNIIDKNERRYSPQNMTFSVYEYDNETPMRSGKGRAMAISPDAHYLAVQTDRATSHLYDLTLDTILREYTVIPPEDENNIPFMSAAFSDNGKRIVINTTEAFIVTELTDDYPLREMNIRADRKFNGYRHHFSPDATRILTGGVNTAWLFDADSGALLHTFEEAERYADQWSGSGGFLYNLARTAKDWAGAFTDQFKSGVSLETAFTDDGTKIITSAAGQVIRIWDAATGNLIHIIHTRLPEKRNDDGYISNNIITTTNGRYAFCYNGNGYGIATLWSLSDGALQRRYQLPQGNWMAAVPAADGSAVYINVYNNLYRWLGAQ
ncbi:MAG TPA: PQQ-binding-like beta-propeller repeat protein [Candidatus Hydrogenedentes bacterium]|nr:PQQ-binding-like beta-propeller repeat protein [Candidatus Hydrogenedentota bacterium]